MAKAATPGPLSAPVSAPLVEGTQPRCIEAQEAGQHLDRWLRAAFPGLTQGRIEKLCRKARVRPYHKSAIVDVPLLLASNCRFGSRIPEPVKRSPQALSLPGQEWGQDIAQGGKRR